MKPIQVFKDLRQAGFTDITFSQVKEAMAKLPYEQFIAQKGNPYHYVVWDKVSPINGVDAETVMRTHRVNVSDTCIVVYEGKKAIIFQPYRHTMTTEEIKQEAERLIGDMLHSRYYSEWLDEIAELIYENL